MKSANEILNMLGSELIRRTDASGISGDSGYMNQYLGGTSFLFAGFLQQLLRATGSEENTGSGLMIVSKGTSFIRIIASSLKVT